MTVSVTCRSSGRFLRLWCVGGQCTLLNGNATELSGFLSTMSWPRSVRTTGPHGVRGRGVPRGRHFVMGILTVVEIVVLCSRSLAGLHRVYLRGVGYVASVCGFLLLVISPVRGVSGRSALPSRPPSSSRLPLRTVAPGTLGKALSCSARSCAVDSDCSCWETPGRFLHHWRLFHQTGFADRSPPRCPLPTW